MMGQISKVINQKRPYFDENMIFQDFVEPKIANF
jgi:hypothetical protein